VRKLIAWVFLYSLDGLLADDGTEYWRFCFGLPVDPAATEQKLELYRGTDVHIMGRTTYEAMSSSMTTATDHPFAPILNTAPKVVFSRTLTSADWANTSIATGDTAAEIEALRRGGDGSIVAWGGVGLWRSLMELDLVDEFYFDVHPYVAGEGTRLFDGFPTSYRLELVSSTPFSNGIVTLHYRRHREIDGDRP
jgi:dihydrofolate reductase